MRQASDHKNNGIVAAVSRHVERVFDPSRKDKRWGRRKLARDQ